jgi:hypothetical protein
VEWQCALYTIKRQPAFARAAASQARSLTVHAALLAALAGLVLTGLLLTGLILAALLRLAGLVLAALLLLTGLALPRLRVVLLLLARFVFRSVVLFIRHGTFSNHFQGWGEQGTTPEADASSSSTAQIVRNGLKSRVKPPQLLTK